MKRRKYKKTIADHAERALEYLGGKAELSDIYTVMKEMAPVKDRIENARNNGGEPNFTAWVRCAVQRDARFDKGEGYGVWKLADSNGDRPRKVQHALKRMKRERSVARLREKNADVKVKRYRMRKEKAILKFFLRYDRGTAEQVAGWISNQREKHAEMTSRQCGQILKRMQFEQIEETREWVPPDRKDIIEEATV